MNWEKLGQKIAMQWAPALGAAMAGPAGAAVGVRVAQALGVDAEPDVIARKLVNDPQAILQLRQLEAVEAEKERTERATIRAETETSIANARKAFGESWMPAAVFMTVSGMASLFVYAVMFHSKEWGQEQWDFVKFVGPILIGSLLVSAVTYFIGSSSGSASKQNIMADQAKTIERTK